MGAKSKARASWPTAARVSTSSVHQHACGGRRNTTSWRKSRSWKPTARCGDTFLPAARPPPLLKTRLLQRVPPPKAALPHAKQWYSNRQVPQHTIHPVHTHHQPTYTHTKRHTFTTHTPTPTFSPHSSESVRGRGRRPQRSSCSTQYQSGGCPTCLWLCEWCIRVDVHALV